ncbi:MAG: hypothetical protein KIT43_00955 [Bauldia sp.]|nr:hypothetical protein [Bauldia sp.]
MGPGFRRGGEIGWNAAAGDIGAGRPVTFLAEARRSLRAAWLLFLDRPESLEGFSTGRAALFRSFAAFFIALPFYAIEIAFRQGDAVAIPGGVILGEETAWLSRIVALALAWVALPLVLALLRRPLGITATYQRFVIARNWGSVLVAIAYAAISPFPTAGGSLGEVGGILSLTVLFLVVRFLFVAARRALDIGIVRAAAVVLLSLVLGWIIDAATSGLIHV